MHPARFALAPARSLFHATPLPRSIAATLVVATLAAMTPNPCSAQSCAGLEDLLNATNTLGRAGSTPISNDGTVAALTRRLPSGKDVACRWTAESGIEELDPGSPFGSVVRAISGDGRVIVGYLVLNGGTSMAFRWRAETGVERISPLSNSSIASNVSYDGSVIVGLGYTNPGGFAWRWEGDAFTYISSQGTTVPIPLFLSDDGLVIAGNRSTSGGTPRAFRWDATTGLVGVGALSNSSGAVLTSYRVEGMSADGNVLAGTARYSDSTRSAFRWTPATGTTELPSLGGPNALVNDVSADGQTIVGTSSFAVGFTEQATVWRAGDAPAQILSTMQYGSFGQLASGDGRVLYATETAFNGSPRGHFRTSGIDVQEVLSETIPLTRLSGFSRDGSRLLFHTKESASNLNGPNRQIRFSKLGTETCRPAELNSTGCFGLMSVEGSDVLSDDALELAAYYLPAGSLGYFLASQTTGFVPLAGGSSGNICLSGDIGRFAAPSEVQVANAGGAIRLAVNVNALPSPTGPVGAMVGERWSFQAWHRDAVGGIATSNFTSAVTIELR